VIPSAHDVVVLGGHGLVAAAVDAHVGPGGAGGTRGLEAGVDDRLGIFGGRRGGGGAPGAT